MASLTEVRQGVAFSREGLHRCTRFHLRIRSANVLWGDMDDLTIFQFPAIGIIVGIISQLGDFP